MCRGRRNSDSPRLFRRRGRKGNRSVSDDGEYVAFIERALADYSVFSNFKNNKPYVRVLEHTSVEFGKDYLFEIVDTSPDIVRILPKFKINDLVGGANVVQYGDLIDMSPSTLRYVKVASTAIVIGGGASFG